MLNLDYLAGGPARPKSANGLDRRRDTRLGGRRHRRLPAHASNPAGTNEPPDDPLRARRGHAGHEPRHRSQCPGARHHALDGHGL